MKHIRDQLLPPVQRFPRSPVARTDWLTWRGAKDSVTLSLHDRYSGSDFNVAPLKLLLPEKGTTSDIYARAHANRYENEKSREPLWNDRQKLLTSSRRVIAAAAKLSLRFLARWIDRSCAWWTGSWQNAISSAHSAHREREWRKILHLETTVYLYICRFWVYSTLIVLNLSHFSEVSSWTKSHHGSIELDEENKKKHNIYMIWSIDLENSEIK